jgi:hypothetical protein
MQSLGDPRQKPDRQLIAEIDARLEAVNAALSGYDELIQDRDRLLRAKAALLGETGAAEAGGKRITQDQVASFLQRSPGSKPGEIALALGVNQPTISAHLYRGKNARFMSREGRWYLRSSGIG